MKQRGERAGGARRLLAGSCLAAMAALSHPAMAQDQAAPQGAADTESGIQDIVVTARYTNENLQDTPIAITAQTDKQLEAANVTSISTLGSVVPNLQTVPGDSQSAGTPRISLRGVQQGVTSSLAVPPAIAIYTDDVYHSTTAGSELDFTDVVRVEVNRGPQSTLSGNASIGGSIKLFTQDPKGDGSGFLSLGYGSRNHMEAAGAFDLGLSPTLSIRALGHFEKQRGYGNRLDFSCMMDKLGTPALKGTLPYFQPDSGKKDCVIGHTGGGTKAVGQVKLLWQPTDTISLLLTARHREEDMEETPEIALFYQKSCVNPNAEYPNGLGPQPCSQVPGQPGFVSPVTQLFGLVAYKTFGVLIDNRFKTPERNGGIYDTYATNCRPLFDTSISLPSATGGNPTGFPAGYPVGHCYEPRKTATHNLFSGKLQAELTDNINVTAIGAYTKYDNEFTQNGDQSPIGVVVTHFINLDEMWSGELRFDGKLFNDKLQWVVGGFTVKTDGYQNNFVNFANIYQLSSVHGINKSSSVFGHLDYNITDAWRISGGGRYTHTDIAITIDNPQAVSVHDARHATQNRLDWLISTDFKINDDILLYASAASGSRPPGLTTIIQNARQLSATSDEDLISYEAGVKADLLGHRLRTNLTAFYLDYKKLSTGVQGTQCLNEPGTGQATWFNAVYTSAAATAICQQFPGNPLTNNYSINIGIPATVKGFEWEIAALPVDGLRIDWTGGYNKFKSGIQGVVPLAPGQTNPPGFLYPGNHRQSEWNMHANISYDIESDFGTLTPRLDWNWQSQQDYDTAPQNHAPDPDFIIPAYSLFNAQLAYTAPSRDWTATLSVTNLANKWHHYQVFRGSFNAQTRVGAPREFMFTVRKTF